MNKNKQIKQNKEDIFKRTPEEIKYDNIFKKALKKAEKNSLIKTLASEIKSHKLIETYGSLCGNNNVINKHWEISDNIKDIDKLDKNRLKKEIERLAYAMVEERDDLLFSLLDQGGQRYGTDGHWKYKEEWNDEIAKYVPTLQFTDSGDIAYWDGNPFLGYHFNDRKFESNICNATLTTKNIKKAKDKLIKWDKDYKEKEFYLLTSSNYLDKKFGIPMGKTTKDFLGKEGMNLISLFSSAKCLKNIKWALILSSKHSSPFIFQNRGVLNTFDKMGDLCVGKWRGNIAWYDWKKIIVSYK